MPKHYRLLTLALLALAGCKTADPLVRVETVTLPVTKHVQIPRELTEPCPIAEGTRAQVFEVARMRKEALEKCNGDKAAIRKLSDKAAKAEKAK